MSIFTIETWKKRVAAWRRAALCFFVATVLIAIQEIPALFGIENTLLRIVGSVGYAAQAAGAILTIIVFVEE